MNRNEVFLQEIGVGVQWRLRNAAPGAAEPHAGNDVAGAAETAEPVDLAAAVMSAYAAHEPAAARHEAPAQAPGLRTVQPPAAQPAPAQPAAALPPAAQRPAAQPAAARPAPGAAASDDTAWFDDAPVPATPPPVVTKSPAKPVQAAPARPPAAGAEEPESTAWFDDVPMPAATPAPGSARAQQAGQQIADMDWTALQAAVSTCTRCDLCHSRQAAVPGRGDPHAQWLVLGTAPAAADEQEVRAIAGAAGQLLDNMLKAIALTPDEDAYVTTLVKCRPPAAPDGSDSLPTPEQLAACRPYLQRELELAGSRMILTLGHTAGKGLLGAAARGKVLRYDGIPTIATYHPADLLRKPADKARAWSDLCLAKAAHAGRA
ncbi:hypothetical protein ASD15_06105 [Massilia sp. Root351]|uniref:uracil-DNA glycosylase n=1 Tax=Massilia sp. Root351 TaxID=1736522 RepID=UPI00070ED22D|nr:uracil-DNA glycosylase [Massilia sp. Root351]KQV84740.1 hypothetical protein ASD15_06105 [Massilia sp. Root351]